MSISNTVRITKLIYKLEESDGRKFACIGCGMWIEEGQEAVIESAPNHEGEWVGAWWHESCWDAEEYAR